MDIETVVQEKLDADTDFQTSLADLSDEDKHTAISTKKSELTKAEFVLLEKKAEEAENKFNDQRTRAEKAEKEAKKAKPAEEGLSQTDLLAIAKADVHEDDMDKVINFAKSNKLSIKEALKDDDLKVLRENWEEKRKSAEIANAKGGRSGPQKVTDEVVIDKTFDKGEIPTKGSEEAERLFWARRKK